MPLQKRRKSKTTPTPTENDGIEDAPTEKRVAGRLRSRVAREEAEAQRARLMKDSPTRTDIPEKHQVTISPDESNSLAAMVANTHKRADTRRRLKERTKGHRVQTVAAQWQSSMARHYPLAPVAELSGKQCGQLRRHMDTVEFVDDRVTWVALIDWFISDYGTALSLAIPWMLEDPLRFEELVQNTPPLNLFIYFSGRFADAYVRLYYGEGYAQTVQDDAARVQRQHRRWMERVDEARRTKQSKVGHHVVSLRNMTQDELAEYAGSPTMEGAEVLFDSYVSEGMDSNTANQRTRQELDRQEYRRRVRTPERRAMTEEEYHDALLSGELDEEDE